MKRPNVTTQAIPGFDYEVFVGNGPVKQETLQAFADRGFEPIVASPAPGNQTQVIFRKPKGKDGLHPNATR